MSPPAKQEGKMKRTVILLILSVAMLATVGFASANSATGGLGSSPVIRLTPAGSPAPAVQAPVVGNAGPTTVRWDKFYDRSGNPLPSDPQDAVGTDSLYWKDFASTTYLKSSAKVQNPTPANRTAMSFHAGQATTCMDPNGDYVYEVNGTSLYRFSTVDGSMTPYTLSYTGGIGCATDGQYIYVPSSSLSKTIYKYTMTGAYVNSTTLDTAADAYAISFVNDTIWACPNRYSHVYYGYAASKFTGGSITPDATWDVGTGTNGVGNIAWDGTHYYVIWIGTSPITFKRFYSDRTIYSTGTVSIDPRSVMCRVLSTARVVQDSLYWKSYYSTTDLYSSPKAQDPTPAQPTPFSWQESQSVPGMTPDGQYVFEVVGTNMRRTNLLTGAVDNYTIADAGTGQCGTEGQYVYVPNGTTMRKYSLTGTLVSTTTTDYAPYSGWGFGVANDTVWSSLGNDGTTWYGYACSKFTGGSITHDATWSTSGGSLTAITVAYDGQYYYMTFGGYDSNTFLRFYRDRTLYSTGTVTGDTRSVMCKKGDYAVMICYGASYTAYVASLAQMLTDSSGGKFAAVDTYHIGTGGGGGHATFPATDWYNQGYRAILTFTDEPPVDAAALGDSLARFVQLGGGVVEAPFADVSAWSITGNWRSTYAPFTLQSYSGSPGTMGTVHDPLHPIMSGVSALYVSNWRTGNTHSNLRSANCACLSEYTDANLCLAAGFDSAGQRAASLGFYPLDYWIATATGQWCRLMVNALKWTAVGPSVSVAVPNGGESWIAGTVHNITWGQTGNGVRDSIYYSTDAGSNWTGVAYYDPPPVPLQHAWTVPLPATTQARVKIVTWNADGGRVEDKSNADFTIVMPVRDVGVLSIIQPVDTVDSGATVVPTATVRNFGDLRETFPVRFNIGGFYTADTAMTLDPGVTDTVFFLDWVASQIGTHAVRCSTRMAGDGNDANDRALGWVVVESPPPGIAQSENNVLPLVFALNQTYPNPLASGAEIRYALPRPAQVDLHIYDVAGTLVRRLVDGAQPAGYRRAYWNGSDDRGRLVAPGVYYCRFRAGDFLAAQKLVVRR
jgi:hypothetical protein